MTDDEVIDEICAYVGSCVAKPTCSQLIACVSCKLGVKLTPAAIARLISCSNCVNDTCRTFADGCGANGPKPPPNSPPPPGSACGEPPPGGGGGTLPCDVNGDGGVDCADLKLLIAIDEACRTTTPGCGPAPATDRAELINDFIAACWTGGQCIELVACLLEAGQPIDVICAVQSASAACAGVCGGSGGGGGCAPPTIGCGPGGNPAPGIAISICCLKNGCPGGNVPPGFWDEIVCNAIKACNMTVPPCSDKAALKAFLQTVSDLISNVVPPQILASNGFWQGVLDCLNLNCLIDSIGIPKPGPGTNRPGGPEPGDGGEDPTPDDTCPPGDGGPNGDGPAPGGGGTSPGNGSGGSGGGGGGGSGGGASTMDVPPSSNSAHPVSFAHGNKLENAVDLSIATPAGGFTIRRSYSSAPLGGYPALVGENWSLSTFRFLRPVSTSTNSDLELFSSPSRVSRYVYSATDQRWYPKGSTSQYIVVVPNAYTFVDDSNTTVSLDVWRLVSRGGVSLDFIKDAPGADQSGARGLNGLIAQTTDRYGWRDVYRYAIFDPSGAKAARLAVVFASIHPDQAASPPEEVATTALTFSWVLGGPETSIGKLGSIRVLRRRLELGASQPWVNTHRVDYTYLESEDPAFNHKGSINTDLGSPGDLIQVTHSELLNADSAYERPQWYRRVTQYRYYQQDSIETGIATVGEALDDPSLMGRRHQLKLVIQPEQIEFAAQRASAGIPGQSPLTAVTEYAKSLWTVQDKQALGIYDLGSDGAPLGTELRLVDLAAKVVGYDVVGTGNWASAKVARQYVQASCGCAGSSVLGVRWDYTYGPQVSDGGITWRSARIDESKLESTAWVPYRRRYVDMNMLSGTAVPYVVNDAGCEIVGGALGRCWVSHYEYDTSANRNRLVKVFTPAAKKTYVPFDDATRSATQTPLYQPYGVADTAIANRGLVYAFEHTADNRTRSMRVGNGDMGAVTNFTPVWEATYGDDTGDTRTWLQTSLKRYRTDASSPTDDQVELTTFTYGFHSTMGMDAVAYAKISVERELASENGPAGGAGTYDTYNLVGRDGLRYWRRDADNALTFRDFDPLTGAVTRVLRNAPPAPSGIAGYKSLSGTNFGGVSVTSWGRFSEGGSLETTFVVDDLGRTVKTVRPGNVTSYDVRTLRTSTANPGVAYLARISLPHRLQGVGAGFDGPAAVTLVNAGGRAIEQSEYLLSDLVYQPEAGLFSLKTEAPGSTFGLLARSAAGYNVLGQRIFARRWHTIAPETLASPDSYYHTSFGYDSLGRMTRSTDPEGTVTAYGPFDARDRALELSIGTTSGAPQVVVKYYYDSGVSTTQGTGNGNMTRIESFPDGPSGTPRVTIRRYDPRDRLIQTEPPAPPYEAMEYDNLDRVVHRGVFSSLPSTPGAVAATAAGRGMFSKRYYSQRGLPYRQTVATDPGSATSTAVLRSDSWFDANGRVLATWEPSSPTVKRSLDGLGRTVKSYLADRPGATDGYDVAIGVAESQVIEQTEYAYTDSGEVSSILQRYRNHDASGLGELGDANSVRTFTGYLYDDALRTARTLNYGTGDTAGDTFKNGSLPSWPPASTPSWNTSGWDAWIITAVSYDERGLVRETTDPLGRVTRVLHDPLSRRTAVVENHQASDPVSIEWDPGATPPRWKAVSGLSSTNPDRNRVTSYVYDGNDHIVQQVAHLPGSGAGEGDVQVTRYQYGTTAGSASIPTDSLLASQRLLREVNYPNETTGQADTSDAYTVKYAYNGLGELRAVTDQNGTIHVYTRDALGRVTLDAATVATGSGIDNTVRSISASYDDFGRLETVESLGASATLNSVSMDYTPLWQVQTITQDPMPGYLPPQAVQYEYDTVSAGGSGYSGNYSRLGAMVYPSGTRLNYSYAGSDIDNRISRLSALGWPSATIVKYDYVGASMFATANYDQSNYGLDRTYSSDGRRRTAGKTSQDAGVYPGWDRFGRVKLHAWVLDAADHSSTTGAPTLPAVYSEAFGYDRASNRLSKDVARPSIYPGWEYSYDGLDRLIQARRGAWTGGSLTPQPGSQKWELDTLGNWTKFAKDLSPVGSPGLGQFTDAEDLLDARQHNLANELGQRSAGPGDGSGSAPALPFAYDPAGNMTAARQDPTRTRRYVHDAWNRLVEARIADDAGAGTGPEAAVLRSSYNGLHQRVVKLGDVRPLQDASAPALSERRVMYYDASWRLVQEEVDDLADQRASSYKPSDLGAPASGTWLGWRRAEQVWGARYIDDAVLRREDRGAAAVAPTPADPGDPVPADPGSPARGPNGTFRADQAWHQVGDAQFSVVALSRLDTGTVVDRVWYDPYGNATLLEQSDANGDGVTDTADIFAFLSLWFAASPSADFNGDGVRNTADIFAFLSAWFAESGGVAVPLGWISHPPAGPDSGGPDNPIGYCGYVFNRETSEYTVRFRHYSPALGRWLERDPLGSHVLVIAQQVDGVAPELGYVDGMNLSEYVRNDPVSGIDPEGLRDLTNAERQGICNNIQRRYDSGQLDVNSYRSARSNFDCDGVGIGERIGRALTGGFVATCGGAYGYIDCLGECIDENSSLIANLIVASGNVVPAIGTGSPRNLNPMPKKRLVLPGQKPNTTNWRNLWQKLPPGLKRKLPGGAFKWIGRANLAATLIEGGYMAGVEAYCAGHCAGLPSGQRYQSNSELKDKSGVIP